MQHLSNVVISICIVCAVSLMSQGVRADDFDLDDKAMSAAPVKEVKQEAVKVLNTAEELQKSVETKVIEESPAGLLKGEVVEVLGIAAWALILCAVLTQYLLKRVKKLHPRKRLTIHKVFGAVALLVATAHGIIVLFW